MLFEAAALWTSILSFGVAAVCVSCKVLSVTLISQTVYLHHSTVAVTLMCIVSRGSSSVCLLPINIMCLRGITSYLNLLLQLLNFLREFNILCLIVSDH